MIVMLLPDTDFDPTESALPWFALRKAGHELTFATPSGKRAAADERLVRTGFGPLTPVLMTKRDDIATYLKMEADEHFVTPIRHDELDPRDVDMIIIPGGHAPGMKTMLESEPAQRLVARHMRDDRPLAAVCHGVLLVARSIDPSTNRSVLHGRRTTALPRTMELSAWAMTKPFLGDYYRTYPTTVQDEVEAALESKEHFDAGPLLPKRDDAKHPGFVVKDRSYVSARWPGDCNGFARACVELAEKLG